MMNGSDGSKDRDGVQFENERVQATVHRMIDIGGIHTRFINIV